jgi:hypothetical protein
VQTASAFAASAALSASLLGLKPVGDILGGAAVSGPVRALALSQASTSLLTFATLVRAAARASAAAARARGAAARCRQAGGARAPRQLQPSCCARALLAR